MSRLFVFFALLPSLAFAAEADSRERVYLSVGAAYGIPFSKFASGEDAPWLLDVYAGMPAGNIEAGVHIKDGYYVAAYGHVGLPDVQGPCLPVQCEAHHYRVGAQLRYQFASDPQSRFWVPWVALGGGFESTGFGWRTPNELGTYATFLGPEAYLSAGADRRLWKYASAGVFVGVSAGPYLAVDEYPIDPVGVHYWGTVGLRLTFLPLAN